MAAMLLDGAERQQQDGALAVQCLDLGYAQFFPTHTVSSVTECHCGNFEAVPILRPASDLSTPGPGRAALSQYREMSMKRRRLIAAAAIALGMIAVNPAHAEDITLEFTVWNYSLDTIQDNARKFEAEN